MHFSGNKFTVCVVCACVKVEACKLSSVHFSGNKFTVCVVCACVKVEACKAVLGALQR